MTTPTKFLVALLSTSLLISGCEATSYMPPSAVVRWPEPMPQPRQPLPPQAAPMQTQPNFASPSAPHCALPVQTVEVEFVLQTRSHDHVRQVIEALDRKGFTATLHLD